MQSIGRRVVQLFRLRSPLAGAIARLLFASLLLCGANASHATTFSFTPSADATISAASPTVNAGTATTLGVKWNNDNNTRKSYIQFNLTDAPTVATNATLTLTFNPQLGGARTYELFGLNDSAAGNNWSETGITWNNAPANDPAASFTSDATLLLSSSLASATTTVTFSGAALTNFLNTDTDHMVTFMVFRTNANATLDAMNSREAASGGPVLVVPEPSVAAMALLGLPCILGRRKRRRT